MLETILLIPFIVVMIFFIYQSYITANKVQVVQKYLKAQVIGSLMNRHEVTAVLKSEFNDGRQTPTDGQFFFVYNEFGGEGPDMNAGLDKATASILLTFMTDKGGRDALEQRLTKGQKSFQAMGLCIGGRAVMANQVSTAVLGLQEGQTCGAK
jgi:hypothetical protein